MIQIDERFAISVGKRLKALRKQHDLTVSQVVDKLSKNYVGMSEKSIQRYENGKCLPKIENLIGLADLFHTTLDYIMLGKETSDDNSCTIYDNFKRLNRLIYSLSVMFARHQETGKMYLELTDDEAKVYWERLQSFAVSKNYFAEHRNETPVFTLKELDELFEDFAEEKEQFAPTPQRYNTWLKNQGIDPEAFWKKKILELEKKREETV